MRTPIAILQIVAVGMMSASAFGQATMSLKPAGGVGNAIDVLPGSTVKVEVFIGNVAPTLLRGYQSRLPLQATGGSSGFVRHDGATPVIDEARTDFIFGTVPSSLVLEKVIGPPPRILGLIFNAADSVLVTTEKYGGDFTYTVSANALGVFTIDFLGLDTEDTTLGDNVNGRIPFTAISATIRVICQTNADCDNNLFCDGAEMCVAGDCVAGTPPCPQPGQPFCNESTDACVECFGVLQCDDGNVCTDDVCTAGACSHPPVPVGVVCGDQTVTTCTAADSCDGAGVCQPNDAVNGTVCDDGLFCTDGDGCLNGACAGGPPRNCGDSLPCTIDTCNEATTMCEHVLGANQCLINNVCFASGQENPQNECLVCNPGVSTSAWTPKNDGIACADDGNVCSSDSCSAGTCVHPALPNNTPCADGVFCNGDELCQSGTCQAGTNRATGIPCGDPTITDCNLRDICDGFGACDANFVPDLTTCTDDGNDCTSDSCLGGQCVHPNKSANTACGDGLTTTCTSPDFCDGAGLCLPNHTPDGTTCDDNDPFTNPDACSGGVCVGAAVPPPLVMGVNAFRVRITPQPAGSLVPQAIFVSGDSADPLVSCASGYVQTDGTLSSTPVFLSAVDWGVVEAMDRSVMRPSSLVEVRAETLDGARTDASVTRTLRYGDTNNDDIVNLFDLFCLLDEFMGNPSGCLFVDADLHPCEPNGSINLFDLFEILNSFSGQGYPCAGACAGGACCRNGNCAIALASECVAANQTFLGTGIDCEPNPCSAGAQGGAFESVRASGDVDGRQPTEVTTSKEP